MFALKNNGEEERTRFRKRQELEEGVFGLGVHRFPVNLLKSSPRLSQARATPGKATSAPPSSAQLSVMTTGLLISGLRPSTGGGTRNGGRRHSATMSAANRGRQLSRLIRRHLDYQ
ncbi:hypothetical protein RB195_005525 [Necator americanus]|uniref:Uncharacterized protein n=1 Tax=Necator americanus TaxID=51031 RepID=A0ABR1BNA6_NECAM